jgi:protein involved in polysaccharide export with SLBB domain
MNNANSPEATGQDGTATPTYGTTGAGAINGLQGRTSNGLPTPGLTQSNPRYEDENPYFRFGYNYSPYFPVQPATEFQRVVAGTVGRMLPIYGANLFTHVPATFAPVDRVPVTPDYVIGPGDEVLIRVWGQVSFNVHATVDRTGDIYLPQVGDLHLAGLQFSQLDAYLKSQLGRVFRNFDVNANMGQLRSIQVFVVGQAQRPGSYTVSSLSTLINTLFASGGPSNQGSMRRIQVKRGDKVITTFDLYDLLLKGDTSKDVPLLSGDVIYIPPVGPRVAIAGSVQVPAIYELKGDETAKDAIQLAGGFTTMAAKQSAQLDRISIVGTRETVNLPFDATGLQTPMRDGDILRVPSLVQRFDKTVTLRGNVANPGRYAWHPGMRISDLIPNKESLITRYYWQRRMALGLPAPDYRPLYSAYPQQSARSSGNAGQSSSSSGQNAGSSQLGSSSLAESQELQAGDASPSNGTGQGTASATQNGSNSSALGSSSTQARAAGSTEPIRMYPPGDRFSEGQFPIRNEIIRTAPNIDWSYAVIERTNPQNFTTSLVPFNLGQLILDDDASQNLELEPGDVITIFSNADIRVPQMQQTKYVRLEGEFVHAGIYSVLPGETLRQLVIRVGGLTPQAYLYGSELLRESTQRQQQARLTLYADQMEHDIEGSSSNAANLAVSPQEAATVTTSLASQKELVATLRGLRASGRLVLNMNPYSSGVDALPNLPLEDGDRFVVPSVPSTVNVIGAVYDQNSFLYQRGAHVGDYMRKAGGATRNGDRKHAFIIRADGSVLSKQYAGGTLFGGGFDSKYLYPGDTVVVPDSINKVTFLRGLTDYSTILSQFGLGIAALTVLGL